MKIARLTTYPLTCEIGDSLGTSQHDWKSISILMVRVETNEGHVGWGEGLARRAPRAYAHLVDDLLAPLVIGADPFAVEAIWARLYRVLSGRSGGMLLEAMSAIDIALWDIMGKATGCPVHRLLGHMDRTTVDAYASSVGWNDDAIAEQQTLQMIAWGFRQIKVKIGAPVNAAIRRARLVREIVGDVIRLMADANWIFDVDDALVVAKELAELGYAFLEEPIVPEDVEGYRLLARKSPIRIAAGESEYTSMGFAKLISDRSIGLVQPDVARSGGITETRKIISLARAFHTAYAPHIGFSGAVCAAASLQLAASSPNFDTYECMTVKNPLRDSITVEPVADPTSLVDGRLLVPNQPGLGIEIDEVAVKKYLA